MTIHLFDWSEAEAIPIDLAEQDGTYVVGLWRDDCGDRFGCICAWNACGAGRFGWRPHGYLTDGTSQVHPTHWVPVPRF